MNNSSINPFKYSNLEKEEPSLEVSKLKRSTEMLRDETATIFRKKWIWRISLVFIILIPILILIVLSALFFHLEAIIYHISEAHLATSSANSTLNNEAGDINIVAQFGSLWHIYLIIFIVLSSMLSLFLTINRLTWKDARTEFNNDAIIPAPQVAELIKNILQTK